MTYTTQQLKYIILLLLQLQIPKALGWGALARKYINKHAVFTLPSPLFTFYKHHLPFITENAVAPDNRRFVDTQEAPRHYINLECYKDGNSQKMPHYWQEALELYTEDTLMQYGILPWHIYHVKHQLTAAFRQQDIARILRLSADIGHYIADAHVPLHTSENYDGQLTGQEGIHALWEIRLPALFIDKYDFFVGQATYISPPQAAAWMEVYTSHQAVNSVLRLEKQLSAGFPANQKYSFEQRGGNLQKEYSLAYAKAYHTMLQGQVEHQMRAAIKMVGDFWFTCWMDAGQPNLDALLAIPTPEVALQAQLSVQVLRRDHCCR